MVRKSTQALVFHKNEILLLLRDNIPTISYPGTWSLIGGGVEEGELFDDCFKREVEEEIGIIPHEFRFWGNLRIFDPAFDSDVFDVGVYLVELSASERSKVKLGNEGQQIRFFIVEELEKLPQPYINRLLFEKNSDLARELFNPEKRGKIDLAKFNLDV